MVPSSSWSHYLAPESLNKARVAKSNRNLATLGKFSDSRVSLSKLESLNIGKNLATLALFSDSSLK